MDGSYTIKVFTVSQCLEVGGGRRDVTGCTSHQAVLPGVRPGRRLHNTENNKSESHTQSNSVDPAAAGY